jgi:PAS domain S-box-containing protein
MSARWVRRILHRRWLEYTGLPLDRALGWGWAAAVHPDDLNRLTDRWRDLIASGQSGEMEARMRRESGEHRWFLFRMGPSRDHHGDIIRWYGIATDLDGPKRTDSLTSLQQMLDDVRGSEANLRRIIDRSLREPFAAISTTDSTCFLSRPHRYAIGKTTSRSWSTTSSLDMRQKRVRA